MFTFIGGERYCFFLSLNMGFSLLLHLVVNVVVLFV